MNYFIGHGGSYRISVATLLLLVSLASGASASRCDEKSAICGPECVATERILNLYGLYATSSVLMSLPRINSVYVLCFSRNSQNRMDQSSDIFCMTGTMDQMQTVQPQHVLTIPGRISNFEEFREDSSQYVLIHTDLQPVQMYEVIQQDRSYVSFSFVHSLGGRGASQSIVIKSGAGAQSSGVVIVTTSGKICQAGDQSCLSPSIHTLVGESLTQCASNLVQEKLTAAAELVTGWNDGVAVYTIFASPYLDGSPVYRVQLYRLVTAVTGECHLESVQDIVTGEPVCGIRSLEVVHSFDGKTFLLIARRPCPDAITGYIPPSQANIILKIWDQETIQFGYSPISSELADTTGVLAITSISKQFFLCQRESSPSTIHTALLPGESSVVSTVRINNQAHVKSVESRNGDVFLIHVTSVGAVVVDWLSCILNQQRPSNYSMTPYGSSRPKMLARNGPFYRNNTRFNGRPLNFPSSQPNLLPSTVNGNNAKPIVTRTSSLPYNRDLPSHTPGLDELGTSYPPASNSLDLPYQNQPPAVDGGARQPYEQSAPPNGLFWLNPTPNYPPKPDQRPLSPVESGQNQRNNPYTDGMAHGEPAPILPYMMEHPVPERPPVVNPQPPMQYAPPTLYPVPPPPQLQAAYAPYVDSRQQLQNAPQPPPWHLQAQQQLYPPPAAYYGQPVVYGPQSPLPLYQRSQPSQPVFTEYNPQIQQAPYQPSPMYTAPQPQYQQQWPSNLALADVNPNQGVYGYQQVPMAPQQSTVYQGSPLEDSYGPPYVAFPSMPRTSATPSPTPTTTAAPSASLSLKFQSSFPAVIVQNVSDARATVNVESVPESLNTLLWASTSDTNNSPAIIVSGGVLTTTTDTPSSTETPMVISLALVPAADLAETAAQLDPSTGSTTTIPVAASDLDATTLGISTAASASALAVINVRDNATTNPSTELPESLTVDSETSTTSDTPMAVSTGATDQGSSTDTLQTTQVTTGQAEVLGHAAESDIASASAVTSTTLSTSTSSETVSSTIAASEAINIVETSAETVTSIKSSSTIEEISTTVPTASEATKSSSSTDLTTNVPEASAAAADIPPATSDPTTVGSEDLSTVETTTIGLVAVSATASPVAAIALTEASKLITAAIEVQADTSESTVIQEATSNSTSSSTEGATSSSTVTSTSFLETVPTEPTVFPSSENADDSTVVGLKPSTVAEGSTAEPVSAATSEVTTPADSTTVSQ